MENIILYEKQLENICWINSKEIKINHKFLEKKMIIGFKPVYDLINYLEKKDSIDIDLVLLCHKIIYCFKDIKFKSLELHNYYKSLLKTINIWSTLSYNETPTYNAHKKDMYDNILLPINECIYCKKVSSIQSEYDNVLIKINALTKGILQEYKTIKNINNEGDINIFINKWTKVCNLLLQITNKFFIKVNSFGIHIYDNNLYELKEFINNILNICIVNDLEYIELLINIFNINKYKI